MLNKYLKESVRGFALIRIEGYFVERFINLSQKREILLWDIINKSSGMVEAKVLAKDYKKLRDISKITKCKIKVIGKSRFAIYNA